MRGHIRKRGNKWCAVIDVGTDPLTGRRKQKWLSGFNTSKEAERAAADFISKYESGQYADPQNMTLGGFLHKWLEDYAATNVAPTTYASYEDAIKNNIIPALGKIKLEKLKPAHIQAFLSKLQKERKDLSTTTIRYYFVVLNAALNTAVKWQLLSNNPCKAVTPPKKNHKEIAVLNEQQVNYLLEQSKGTPLYIPILLALTCGLRRGEALGLKWENVNLKEGIIYISENRTQANGKVINTTPKTKKSNRSLSLPEITVKALKEERKRQLENKLQLGQEYQDLGYVVCWDDGTPYRPDYITHALPKLLKKLELPEITYHDLRHTHATLLLLKGVHPKIVQERLGHYSISITLDTYSHLMPSMQQEAAKKLDTVFQG